MRLVPLAGNRCCIGPVKDSNVQGPRTSRSQIYRLIDIIIGNTDRATRTVDLHGTGAVYINGRTIGCNGPTRIQVVSSRINVELSSTI